MRYLLDTCALSELVKPRPNQTVVEWIEACAEEDAFLSVLTIGEIQKGIAKLRASKRRTSIQRWLDGELRIRFADRILPIDEEVAATWGLIVGENEQRGEPIPTVDGLLGATAVVHNLTVVTRNEQDISRTGARVLNPWR